MLRIIDREWILLKLTENEFAYLKKNKVDEIEEKFRVMKPEMSISWLNHRNTFNDVIVLHDL